MFEGFRGSGQAEVVELRTEHVGEHKVMKPILCFPGGKSKLARIMTSGNYIPSHQVYVEPFFGGGSVFFAKPLAEVNVINDIDTHLMGFYEGFRDLPRFDCDMTPDRGRFERLKGQLKRGAPLDPCDYQYLARWSMNCMMRSFSPHKHPFCNNPKRMKTCGIVMVIRDFEKYKDKLNHATILNKDFREVIREYDSPDTFFFIDPPYFAKDFPGAQECHYQMYGGCEVSPQEVLEVVRGITGKFMITYPNMPELQRLFEEFNQTTTGWRYTGATRLLRAGPIINERIITNYEIIHE